MGAVIYKAIPNSVATAIEHRGICGALTLDTESGEVWAQGAHLGVSIQSLPAPKFDLFDKPSQVQANWDAAVDAYLSEHPEGEAN